MYVSLLRRLYDDQRATVRTDETSRVFGIFRGTKQGDPISPILFNSFIKGTMQVVKQKWQCKRWGVQLSCLSGSEVTNLWFADHILVVG